MTRVSSAMIPMSSLVDLSRAQQELVEAGRQSSEQTRANDLKGFGRDAQTLVSARRLVARNEGFQATANELYTRMQIQDVAVTRAGEAVSKLKQELFQNWARESGLGIRSQVEETFAVLKDTMNTTMGGRYLFGGVLDDRPPITADTVSELAANPITSSLEQGADRQYVRVEEGRTVPTGIVASDFVTDALASLKRLAEMDQGPDGPFGNTLSSVQKQAIESELGTLSGAFDKMLAQQAEHGRLTKEVDAVRGRLTSQRDALDQAIGGIVDVDLAQVAVRLNQAQFAYQSSASVFNVLRGLSLLEILK